MFWRWRCHRNQCEVVVVVVVVMLSFLSGDMVVEAVTSESVLNGYLEQTEEYICVDGPFVRLVQHHRHITPARKSRNPKNKTEPRKKRRELRFPDLFRARRTETSPGINMHHTVQYIAISEV